MIEKFDLYTFVEIKLSNEVKKPVNNSLKNLLRIRIDIYEFDCSQHNTYLTFAILTNNLYLCKYKHTYINIKRKILTHANVQYLFEKTE